MSSTFLDLPASTLAMPRERMVAFLGKTGKDAYELEKYCEHASGWELCRETLQRLGQFGVHR